MRVHWRNHDRTRVRVWVEGWAHDTFNLVGLQEFIEFRVIAEGLGITVRKAEEEEDGEGYA